MNQGMAPVVISRSKAAIYIDSNAILAGHSNSFLVVNRSVAENNPVYAKFIQHQFFKCSRLHIVFPEKTSFCVCFFVSKKISFKCFHRMFAKKG